MKPTTQSTASEIPSSIEENNLGVDFDVATQQSRRKINDLLGEIATLREATRDKAALETLVEQLREANQNLVLATVNAQTLKDEADAANRRQTEFLAMLAHELRNPLAPISTAAQLLKLLKVDEPRVRQASDIISRQVGHMTRLMDDLLDVSRVTRGLVTLASERLDLAVIITGAVEQVRPLIESRRHQLTLRMGAEPVQVQGDRTRLVQIVANLLTNAAKYTPEGGQILLNFDTREDAVDIRVCDNGIGIAADLLPHIFDIFTQGARSPDRSQGGLGLGLALVKSLAGQHGGTVGAHSPGLGQGSTFTVTLPKLEALKQQALQAEPEVVSLQPGFSLRLMIVDDNIDAAQTTGMLLEALGHTVTVVFDAETALAQAATIAPQVILADIGLPGMDGYELSRRLRSLAATRHAILVALTGYGQDQDREQARTAGFDHHLVKPVDEATLTALLSEAGNAIGARAALIAGD